MDTARVNVHPVERIASTVLGGALLLRKLPQRAPISRALGLVLLYRGISGHSYLYRALGVRTTRGGAQIGEEEAGIPEVTRAITIGKSADDLYRYLRDPECIAQVMGDYIEVTQISNDRAHWRLHSPALRMEWDTQVIEDRPGELLRWESLEGAKVPSEGEIRFRPAPGNRGTETVLRLRFRPPGGVLGNIAAKRLRALPSMFADNALRRFKSFAETGEVPTAKNTPPVREVAYAHAH